MYWEMQPMGSESTRARDASVITLIQRKASGQGVGGAEEGGGEGPRATATAHRAPLGGGVGGGDGVGGGVGGDEGLEPGLQNVKS